MWDWSSTSRVFGSSIYLFDGTVLGTAKGGSRILLLLDGRRIRLM